MKVVYIALDPLKYPRIKKIASSLKKMDWVKFEVMIPKFRIVPRGSSHSKRFFLAFANYLVVLLQIFFVKADLFWVANSPDILFLPLIFRRKSYILEYRAPWPLQIELEFGKGLLSRIAKYLTWTGLKHAKVITLTTSTLLKDVKFFGKKFFVIPNYPQKYHFKPQFSRGHFRALQGVKNDEKVVLFMGLLTKVEGVDFLPRTAEKLLRKNKKLVLWIVGDGPLRSIIEELEREFPDNVKFFGWRPHREIPDFINAADVCIGHYPESPLSSYYNAEGLHKIGEYMFFGKPIVACGLAESSQYLVVKENEMAEGILRALNGETPLSTPKTWEGHSEKKILELFSWLRSKI